MSGHPITVAIVMATRPCSQWPREHVEVALRYLTCASWSSLCDSVEAGMAERIPSHMLPVELSVEDVAVTLARYAAQLHPAVFELWTGHEGLMGSRPGSWHSRGEMAGVGASRKDHAWAVIRALAHMLDMAEGRTVSADAMEAFFARGYGYSSSRQATGGATLARYEPQG